MTATLAFWLTLLVRMAVTAGFVVAASLIALRAGPLIGAMFATLPVSTGPIYVFLSLDHDAHFVAAAALSSLVINAATAVYALVYAALAQRHRVLVSLPAAMAAWTALTAALHVVEWTLVSALVFSVVVFVPCLLLSRRFRDVPMPFARRRWYDVPLRAGLVALLVLVVTTLSPYLGPFGSGLLAVFPIVLTSLMLILQPRVGGPATAAVIATTISGLVGFGLALVVLHLAAVPWGSSIALALALAVCVGWNILVLAAHRRGIPI